MPSFKIPLPLCKRLFLVLLTSWAAGFPLFMSPALAATDGPAVSPLGKKQPIKAGNTPSLEQKTFAQGVLYVLKISAQAPYRVVPALSPTLLGVTSPNWGSLAPRSVGEAEKTAPPIFIINGGFFDPKNSLTTSFVYQGGILKADPRVNPQLISNAKLAPYLPKIFNRPEFRSYICQKASGSFQTRYDIALHNAPVPPDCLLQNSIGAGPTLLPRLGDFEEGFVDYGAGNKVIRDPIGVCSRNARSVVGITEKGDLLLMMGAQNSENPSGSGFTLQEMAGLLKARGAVKAMALDGGSSSGFVYQGKAVYGKFNQDKSPVKRPVKSVLMVVPR